MKRIFTLCAIILFLTPVYSQLNETFETHFKLSTLVSKGWQFSDLEFSPLNKLAGTNSLVITPITSAGKTAKVTSPYVNLVGSTTISFDHKLSDKLSNSATRTITARLQALDGSYANLGTQTLDKQSATAPVTFSYTTITSGFQRLVIEVNGKGDGNSYLYLDNIKMTETTPFNTTLAIQLKSFQGLLADQNALLQWNVADNESGNLFELQKSTDGREYKTIVIVSTTQKQGDENYTFKDHLQASAYYRLKIINNNRSATYSNVLFIKKQRTAENSFSLLQNPVKQTLQFSFVSASNAPTEINVYNMLGVNVFKTTFQAAKGNNLITNHLNAQIKGGTYVLEVKNVTNRSIAKFLKD
jgi:hypothetical protein